MTLLIATMRRRDKSYITRNTQYDNTVAGHDNKSDNSNGNHNDDNDNNDMSDTHNETNDNNNDNDEC